MPQYVSRYVGVLPATNTDGVTSADADMSNMDHTTGTCTYNKGCLMLSNKTRRDHERDPGLL